MNSERVVPAPAVSIGAPSASMRRAIPLTTRSMASTSTAPLNTEKVLSLSGW